jgi:hypothetical protein
MNKCLERFHKVLGLFKIYDKHEDIICNFVLDLQDVAKVDLIVLCKVCGDKRVISSDLQTFRESLELYPGAFIPEIRRKGSEL